jgi:phage major head subunit gpT-like protein
MSNGSQGGRSLDSHKIEAAYVGFYTSFMNRLSKGSPLYNRLATVVETDNVVDRQLWLSNVPKMRRWIGPKYIHKLRGESKSIVTSPYEASIEVSKHDILNDKLGLYARRIGEMADAYDQAIDELVVAYIAAGIAGTSLGTTYDNQNLVDTDHTASSAGGTSQSNKVTGALSASTYSSAWQRFLEITDEFNNPVNSGTGRKILLVGPANREAARAILQNEIKTDGTNNLDAGTADLVIHPRIRAGTIVVNGVSVTLTGTEWALIPEGSSSIIVHKKRGPEFLSVEDGEFVFRTGKFLYGIEAEFGADYGLWQEIVGGPGA